MVAQIPRTKGQLAERLERQQRYQAVLNRLTLAIHRATYLDDVVDSAIHDTAQALQLERGLLLRLKFWDPLFRHRQPNQVPKIRLTVTTERLATDRVPSVLNQSFWMAECGLCQYGYEHPAQIIQLCDRESPPSADPECGTAGLLYLGALPSLLWVPLANQGTVLGFLVFQGTEPHTWQPDAIELVELVAAHVSTAILQTETLRQVQALVEKRTSELRQSLAVQAKLYERTRQQIDQLRHLNQIKDEFLSTVSHELRTPLTSMTLAIRMLRQVSHASEDRRSASDQRTLRYLDILEQQCAQEINLVNDLLALQELETRKVQIQPQDISIAALIRDVSHAFSQKWNTKELSLMVSLPKESITLYSDLNSLSRVLLELLTNAGKYSDPMSTIHLEVSAAQIHDRPHVVLRLTNQGAEIPEADLPHIFEKFRRSQAANQNAVPGTGLGLALVKSLVQHLNGTISVTSVPKLLPNRVPGKAASSFETCFTLTLPQAFEPM